MDSKVEYRFPLSFKRQSNLHFWPLFDLKLWISFLNGRSPTKTAQNFQPITDSLLRRQYVVLLTSQKQSKETENRDTIQDLRLWCWFILVREADSKFQSNCLGWIKRLLSLWNELARSCSKTVVLRFALTKLNQDAAWFGVGREIPGYVTNIVPINRILFDVQAKDLRDFQDKDFVPLFDITFVKEKV